MSGSDNTREVLPKDKVSGKSDFCVISNDNKYYIELVSDYTGHWLKTMSCDLRDNKYKTLKEKIGHNSKSYILGIDFRNQKCMFINLESKLKTKFHFEHPQFGNKHAYSIILNNEMFFDFSLKNILDIVNKEIERE